MIVMRYTISIKGKQYYWKGNEWLSSNGSFQQSGKSIPWDKLSRRTCKKCQKEVICGGGIYETMFFCDCGQELIVKKER